MKKRVFYAKKIHTTQLVWISYIFFSLYDTKFA